MYLKILENGEILVERQDDKTNDVIFETFKNSTKNSEELKNFLFQWQEREVLAGDAGLCG
jgi:hypothetical protein